jgi:PPOX class probable F420-dependent enzyme
LTTIESKGGPQPNPVWFYSDNGTLVIYSLPKTARLGHIQERPDVSLNLQIVDGGAAVVFVGTSEQVDRASVAAEAKAGYLANASRELPQSGSH